MVCKVLAAWADMETLSRLERFQVCAADKAHIFGALKTFPINAAAHL